MATNKRQFIQMYDQAVLLLKQYKQLNDALNKSIGLQHQSTLTLKITSQKTTLQSLTKKINQILTLLEASYLDPETARKIGTIKQQYKIQKDRRQHILKQIAQSSQNDHHIFHKQTVLKQTPTYQIQNYKNYHTQKYQNQHKRNSTENQLSLTVLNQEQLTSYDYEIECKLLKEKNRALEQTQKRLRNVYEITNQTKQMVDFQGQHIDVISDQIFTTRSNVENAVNQLKQADKLSKKRSRKVVFSVSLLFLILTIVVISFVAL